MVKLKIKKQILNICADIFKFPKRYGEKESRNVKAVRFCAKADTTDFAPIKITRQPRFSRKLKCVNMAFIANVSPTEGIFETLLL